MFPVPGSTFPVRVRFDVRGSRFALSPLPRTSNLAPRNAEPNVNPNPNPEPGTRNLERLVVCAFLLILLTAPAAAQTPKAAPASVQPESVRALLQRAREQSGRGDAAGALALLGRARAIAPNSEEVLSAFAQLSLAAHAPIPAIVALDALTRICPTVVQHRYLLGVALMRAGDMPAASDALRQAERLEPDRALTLLALGMALNNRKLYADAKAVLVRSLELEPESIDAAAALAEAEQGLGELDAAETHTQRVLARTHAHATAHLVGGLIMMERGRYAEARDAFQRAIGSDPSLSKAHYQLSLAYTRLGDEANAKKHLDLYRQRLVEFEKRINELRSAR